MKKNNKGFSLVELIIVIAIMAVLMAVLAPQFLRYVERSRLQSDNTTLGEIANACKIAATDEAIANVVAGGTDLVVTIPVTTPAALTVAPANADLTAELTATIGNVALTSNTYTGGTAPTIVLTLNGAVVQVQATNYIPDAEADADGDGNIDVEATHVF